jgi:glycosyltransferase involved in cell wall biosynthesis
VSTLVLVTPAVRVDAGDDRFTPGHLRELAARFDHVVMVLDQDPAPSDPRAPARAWPIATTDAPLETVLDSLRTNGTGAGVIIDGDIRAVRRAGTVTRKHAVPALWWCDGPPAEEIQRDTVNYIDAVLAPVDETSVGRYLAIGAGIDMPALPALPLPDRPPLRILVLGRSVNQGGLAAPLRALAETRARGVDARLVIVDSLEASSRSARRATESLVADLMLTQSVELIDADVPLSLPHLLRRIHLVVDAGKGPELDRIVLEAMACARIVLSSRPALTPLLADAELPLVFATGDSVSLAACISAVADARHDELDALGGRLRQRVERSHSLSQWGASIAAVVDALQAR